MMIEQKNSQTRCLLLMPVETRADPAQK